MHSGQTSHWRTGTSIRARQLARPAPGPPGAPGGGRRARCGDPPGDRRVRARAAADRIRMSVTTAAVSPTACTDTTSKPAPVRPWTSPAEVGRTVIVGRLVRVMQARQLGVQGPVVGDVLHHLGAQDQVGHGRSDRQPAGVAHHLVAGQGELGATPVDGHVDVAASGQGVGRLAAAHVDHHARAGGHVRLDRLGQQDRREHRSQAHRSMRQARTEVVAGREGRVRGAAVRSGWWHGAVSQRRVRRRRRWPRAWRSDRRRSGPRGARSRRAAGRSPRRTGGPCGPR